jgi:hypothetical protein
MKEKNATGIAMFLRDALTLFGEGVLRITTQLPQNIYETGECPKILFKLQ